MGDTAMGNTMAQLRFPDIQRFPWWKLTNNKDVDRDINFGPPTVCLKCGKLWAEYNLAKTIKLIERYGSPEIKAKL